MTNILITEEETLLLDNDFNKIRTIELSDIHEVDDRFDIYTLIDVIEPQTIFLLNYQQAVYGIMYSINRISVTKDKVTSAQSIDDATHFDIFSRKHRKPVVCDMNCTFQARKDTTNKNLSLEGNRILSLLMDGSNWRLRTEDGMILGSNKNDKIAFQGRYPVHVKEVLNNLEDVLFANEISAKSIFLNSCSDSLIVGGLYGKNLNVVQNMLGATPSVIAGYRMENGDISENLLYILLLQRGYSCYEVHYILNLNSLLMRDEFSPFINYGRIKNNIPSSNSNLYYNKDKNNSSRVEICCKPQDEKENYYEIDIPLESDTIENIIKKKYRLIITGNDEEVFVSGITYPKEGKVKIIFYSFVKFAFKSSALEIVREEEYKKNFAYLENKISNIRNLRLLGLGDAKNKQRIDNITKKISSLQFKSNEGFHFSSKILDMVHNEEKTFYSNIEKDCLELLGKDFPIELFYSHSLSECLGTDSQKEILCPGCGDVLYVKSIKNILGINRISGVCRNCHNPLDRSSKSFIENPKLLTHALSERDDYLELNITVRNDSSSLKSYFIMFLPTTDYSSNLDDFKITLREKEKFFILQGNEKREFSFTIKRDFSKNQVDKFIDFNIYIFENGSLECSSVKLDFPTKAHYFEIEKFKSDALTHMKKFLSDKRVIHSTGVAAMAKKLASKNCFNQDMAELAGLVHDIAKGYEKSEEYKNLLNSYDIAYSFGNTYFSHAQIGRQVAEKVLNIDDADILSSILWHTSGRKNMSKLEKIVFVADYIEESRTFDNLEYIRELAFNDLDAAIGEIMEYYIQVICPMKGLKPTQRELECRNHYMRKLHVD